MYGLPSVEDVLEWLLTTARRVRVIYETTDFEQAAHASSRITTVSRNGKSYVRLRPGYMLVGAWTLGSILVWPIKLIALMMPFLKWMESFHPVTRLLSTLVYGSISGIVGKLLRDFAGDVTAYTAFDPKLKLNVVRHDILSGCVNTLKAIVNHREEDRPYYDRIIVAGHSLGSVVAYDALSEISNQLVSGAWTIPDDNKERIAGLVTFGSPLDKIAFLFWPLNEDQRARMRPVWYRMSKVANWVLSKFGLVSSVPGTKAGWSDLRADIQAGMVAHYHGLRAKPIMVADNPSRVDQPSKRPLDHVIWLNFFHPNDIIAGHLDAFSGVENIPTSFRGRFRRHRPGFPEAHSYYWYDPKMMQCIIDRFL